MRRFFSLIIIVCAAAAWFAYVSKADNDTSSSLQHLLRVDESSTRIFFGEKAAEILLVVESQMDEQSAKIRLEFVAPNGEAHRFAERETALRIGRNEVTLSSDFKPTAQDALIYYRLHYEIITQDKTLSGIIAISEIAPEIFELEVSANNYLREATHYHVNLQAVQPVSERGVAAVKITGELTIKLKNDREDVKLKAESETNSEGFATLNFEIPANNRLDDAELKITGSKNGLVREAVENINTLASNLIYLNTDKPLYQPGQKLQFRALVLNSANKIVSNLPLKITIEDSEDATIHQAEIKTSNFGVASYSWQIPETARLGGYRIELENEDFDVDRTAYFKVSRYDLPNFVVNAKPDRKFYLPTDETAEIEVRGDYLFGKPVTKARVRVVEELERDWNYREQKYETKEGKTIEGVLDETGKFVAKFDLKEQHKDFEPSRYSRFQDLHFAAYITDLTTNRTEQRRFDVRLTKEPIHVYYIGSDYDASRKLPLKFYVSTFYADGTPASCEISINQAVKVEKPDQEDEYQPVKFLTKVNTNSRGAAKIELPPSFLSEPAATTNNLKPSELDIMFSAVDKDGKRGATTENVEFSDDAAIAVQTDKTIYRKGEPVKVSLLSSEQNATLFVDVTQDLSIVRSARVKLANGRGEITFPYDKDFRDDLQIAAYAEFDDEIKSGVKTVIFPNGRGLKITAETAKNEFRPADEVRVNFKALSARGKLSETALGVVVFDKAIEERARTDGELAGYSDFYGLLGLNSGFGGLTRSELDNLDLRQKIQPETELAAEVFINRDGYYRPNFFNSRDFRSELEQTFKPVFEKQFEPVRKALTNAYASRREYPTDEKSLGKILNKENVSLDSLRDAWSNSFYTKFRVEDSRIFLEVWTPSADKKLGTKDDFIGFKENFYYFQPLAEKLDKAILEYNKRTDLFVRDHSVLQSEMSKQFNVDIDAWRDPWGNPYRFNFSVQGSNFTIQAESSGADGKFNDDVKNYWQKDDFTVWTNNADYFQIKRSELSKALSEYVGQKQAFPKDETAFRAILKQLGFDLDAEKDVFGNQFYLSRTESSRYGNRVEIKKVDEIKTNLTPVTQFLATFKIKSMGADKQKNTADDFELVSFTGVVGEKTKDDLQLKSTIRKFVTANGKGAIAGTVFDPNGAVITGTKATAKNELTLQTFEVKSNDEGYFVFDNLPNGNYELTFDASGFKRTVFNSVPVEPSNVTQLEVTLEIGGTTQTVTVTSTADVVETSDASVAMNVSGGVIKQKQIQDLPLNARHYDQVRKTKNLQTDGNAVETPRLREYFPETLVWQPELITDKRGRAKLKFKLADSLTTWKLAVIGSNLNGDVGIAEKEFQAFMPFFAEHDPPKFLTEGDQIALPVVLRNYLDKPQIVAATMKNESWFRLLSQPTQKITVAPNDSQNAIFNFLAVDYVKEGKQRVTAIGSKASDAIEKPITVRPNGQEIVNTTGKIFRDSATFDVNFPAAALPRTQKALLKIYPNLTAHVAESVEGILQRPNGCAEQTISSSYPSLLWLKLSRNGDNNLKAKAQKYLLQGYQRLVSYQKPDGGFGYWANDAANLALTAYALRFLSEAKKFIEIDDKVLDKTSEFLLKAQRADGSWTQIYSWEKQEDTARTKQITAYIAKTLANNANKERIESAKKALAYLKPRVGEIDDPYFLASFALAAFATGENEIAAKIVDKLKTLTKTEGTSVYWNLETNTPFYGWGNAGRIETTALVLQALINERAISSQNQKSQKSADEELISKTLQFLLKAKDRYGVWYSTQATVNVLDALILALASDKTAYATENTVADVFVNNVKIQTLKMPQTSEIANPLLIDLPNLNLSSNLVEIRQNETSPIAMAQIVMNYYVGWQDSKNLEFSSNDSRGLRLKVDFDKTNAVIGQEILCRVSAERSGFQGYEMLLAEIGLPPGADVDRESLEKAVTNSGWSLSSYDVLPDRVIVYLWAKAGGNQFEFKFKSRYGIEANTAPSQIYDYYNPESSAVLAPTKFLIK